MGCIGHKIPSGILRTLGTFFTDTKKGNSQFLFFYWTPKNVKTYDICKNNYLACKNTNVKNICRILVFYLTI